MVWWLRCDPFGELVAEEDVHRKRRQRGHERAGHPEPEVESGLRLAEPGQHQRHRGDRAGLDFGLRMAGAFMTALPPLAVYVFFGDEFAEGVAT